MRVIAWWTALSRRRRLLVAVLAVIVVAGGVAGAVRALAGVAKARRIITLGSPLHGADLAAVGATDLPGACPAACEELVPGSSMLDRLQGTGSATRPPWLSVWTTDDQVVVDRYPTWKSGNDPQSPIARKKPPWSRRWRSCPSLTR